MAEEMLSLQKHEMSPAKDALEALSRKPASVMGLKEEAARAELNPSTLASNLSIHPAEFGQHLLIAVEKAASKDAESMEALRLAVCSFTGALRDAGTTPEGVLIILKTVIHKRGLLVIAPHASDWTGQLREKITTWCIEEYFSEKIARV
jgi:hypothetical protein